MIQLAAIAIKMGATKEDFDRTVRGASDDGRRAGDDADARSAPLEFGRRRCTGRSGHGDANEQREPSNQMARQQRRTLGRRRRAAAATRWRQRGGGGPAGPGARADGPQIPEIDEIMRKGQEQLRV